MGEDAAQGVTGETIWLDGEWLDWDQAQIHVLTHSLHYGLGVFEGIRCYQTQDGRSAVFRLEEHVRRLYDSARINLMDVPYPPELVSEVILESLRRNGLAEGYIRPLVFIGDGAMGLHPGDNAIRVAVISWAWGKYLGEEGIQNGIRAKVSTYSRHHVNSKMTNGKTCGDYVNSILAKREALLDGYDEAVMLDPSGLVSECTGENIFVVRDGVIRTPPAAAVLNGITRATLMTLASDRGMAVEESPITRDDLYIADEIFLTGTAAEVTPIREVDARVIGSGKRGPVTETLQAAYFELVAGKNDAHAGWLTYL